jgi:hypothetical protein
MRIKYVTNQKDKHHSEELDVDERMELNKDKGYDPNSRKVLNIT